MKKIMIIAVILIVCGLAITIVTNKSKTYGLPEDVIKGDKELTAEETIRLFFYYYNRNSDKLDQIIDIPGGLEFPPASLLENVYLIEINHLLTENRSDEQDLNEVQYFNVKYNIYLLYASRIERPETVDVDFTMVKRNSKWVIVSIGNG